MRGVFLRIALGAQEIIIAAAFAAGIFAADGRPGRIDGAAARLGIEEAADAAIMLIRLAAHGIGLVAIHLGEFLARFLEAQPEMVGQALHIFLDEGDDRIGAAIARTFGTIVTLEYQPSPDVDLPPLPQALAPDEFFLAFRRNFAIRRRYRMDLG